MIGLRMAWIAPAIIAGYFVLALALPWHVGLLAATLGVFVWSVGRLSAGDLRRQLAMAAGPAVLLSAAAVAWVLLRSQWADILPRWGALVAALAGASAIAMWPTKLRLPEVTAPVAAPKKPDTATDPWEKRQGFALIVAACTIPIGEGAGFGGVALLIMTLIARRRAVAWSVLTSGTGAIIAGSMVIWLGCGAAAWLFSGHGPLALRELGRLAPLMTLPVYAWTIASLPRHWIYRASWAFIATLTLSAGVGLVQYFGNPATDEWWLTPITHFSSKMQTRVPGEASHMLAGGLYFHRLKLAHVLLIGIGGLAGDLVFSNANNRRRWIAGALLAVLTVALLLTFTRGAILGVAVGTVAILSLAPRRWKLWGGAACIFALASTLMVPTVRDRILSMATAEASEDRALIWSQAVELIEDNPMGCGIGNYPTLVSRRYEIVAPDAPLPRTYPHSLVLSAWAETGVLGLLAYVIMWAALALAVWRSLLHNRSGPEAALAAGALFSIAALWTVGMSHDVLYHKPVALAFAALAGAIIAAPRAR